MFTYIVDKSNALKKLETIEKNYELLKIADSPKSTKYRQVSPKRMIISKSLDRLRTFRLKANDMTPLNKGFKDLEGIEEYELTAKKQAETFKKAYYLSPKV